MEEVLFIDASELGYMIDRKNRTFADEDINKIADTYHNWLNAGAIASEAKQSASYE